MTSIPKLRYSLLLLFFLVASPGFAQKTKPVNELTIDPKTKLPDKLAPFDEYFMLNIPISANHKSKDIIRVNLYRAEKAVTTNTVTKGDIRTNTSYTTYVIKYMPYVRPSSTTGIAYATQLDTVSFEKKEGYNNLKTLVPPLIYGRSYVISVQYSPTPEFVSGISEVAQTLYNASHVTPANASYATLRNTAGKKYNTLLTTWMNYNQDYYSRIPMPLITFTNGTTAHRVDSISITQFDSIFQNKLLPKYDSLNTALRRDNVSIKKLYERFFKAVDSCNVCTHLTECNCSEQLVGTEIAGYYPLFLKTHCCADSFLTSKNRLDLISKNMATIADYLEPAPADAINKRKLLDSNYACLKYSSDYLKKLRELYTSTSLAGHLDCKCMDAIIGPLDSLILIHKNKLEDCKKIKQQIDLVINRTLLLGIGRLHFRFMKFFDINSDVADLKTAAGNFIIPEFGLAFLSPTGTENTDLIIRPYYGINISLTPINKNLRFKDIPNRSFQHYFSVTLGLTYWPINKLHTDIKDLITDASVITGINCRFARGFRLGCGVLHYYKTNPNPVLQMKYAVMPYIGISADVDIVSFATKLTDRIFK